MKIMENSKEEGFRGILILPENMDTLINENLGIHNLINENLSIHMFCLNFESNFTFFYRNFLILNISFSNKRDRTNVLVLSSNRY